uniref:Uncharacterized protein n=1 Tax=Cacopsylla melanoneura TaxID=428564 RepID=A0A8D8RSU4_9HEMI
MSRSTLVMFCLLLTLCQCSNNYIKYDRNLIGLLVEDPYTLYPYVPRTPLVIPLKQFQTQESMKTTTSRWSRGNMKRHPEILLFYLAGACCYIYLIIIACLACLLGDSYGKNNCLKLCNPVPVFLHLCCCCYLVNISGTKTCQCLPSSKSCEQCC